MKPKMIHWSLAIVASATALAQQTPTEPLKPNNIRPNQVPILFAILDTDHDGVISEKELQAASQSLTTIDHNQDGRITMDELRPIKPGGDGGPDSPPKPKPNEPPQLKPQLPAIIVALDLDKNGKISAQELQSAPESLKSLDHDGDGELSLREMMPPPRPREGPPRQGPSTGDGAPPQGPPTGEEPPPNNESNDPPVGVE